MSWMLLLVWVGAASHSPVAAPTALGPFASAEACQHATGQVLAMASDMRQGVPVRGATRAELVHWRCVELRNLAAAKDARHD